MSNTHRYLLVLGITQKQCSIGRSLRGNQGLQTIQGTKLSPYIKFQHLLSTFYVSGPLQVLSVSRIIGKNWRGLWGHQSLVLRSTEIQRHWSFKVDLMLRIPLCPLLSHEDCHLQQDKHSGIRTPRLALHTPSIYPCLLHFLSSPTLQEVVCPANVVAPRGGSVRSQRVP